jgi:hypothetical protein
MAAIIFALGVANRSTLASTGADEWRRFADLVAAFGPLRVYCVTAPTECGLFPRRVRESRLRTRRTPMITPAPRGILLVVALWLVNVSLVVAQDGRLPWYATAAIGAHAGAHAFDLATTGMALTQNPAAVEGNLLLRPLGGNPPALATVDAAMWVAVNYGLWRAARKRPRVVTALAVGLSALEIAIGRHNLSVAHQRP